MKTFDYKNYEKCSFLVTEYYNNRKLAIYIENDEGIITVVTTNIDDYPQEENHAFVKSYSENDGLLQWLIENKFVKSIIGYQRCGYVKFALCDFDMEKIKEYSRQEENK